MRHDAEVDQVDYAVAVQVDARWRRSPAIPVCGYGKIQKVHLAVAVDVSSWRWQFLDFLIYQADFEKIGLGKRADVVLCGCSGLGRMLAVLKRRRVQFIQPAAGAIGRNLFYDGLRGIDREGNFRLGHRLSQNIEHIALPHLAFIDGYRRGEENAAHDRRCYGADAERIGVGNRPAAGGINGKEAKIIASVGKAPKANLKSCIGAGDGRCGNLAVFQKRYRASWVRQPFKKDLERGNGSSPATSASSRRWRWGWRRRRWGWRRRRRSSDREIEKARTMDKSCTCALAGIGLAARRKIFKTRGSRPSSFNCRDRVAKNKTR